MASRGGLPRVVVNPALPEDVVEFRDGANRTVGAIVNVGKPRPGKAAEDELAALLKTKGFHVQTFGEYLWRAERGDVGVVGIVGQYPWGLTLAEPRRFKSDFAQPTSRTLIEIDGGAHRATEKRRRHDVERRQIAESVGYRLVHLLPEQVLGNDGAGALRVLLAVLHFPAKETA